MKKKIIMGLALGVGALAFVEDSEARRNRGCQNRRNVNAYLCPGDRVYNDVGQSGDVIGVNPSTQKATVRWTQTQFSTSFNMSTTVDLKTLAIADGCISRYCIDDVVYDEYSRKASIKAVNPHNGDVLVAIYETQFGTQLDRPIVSAVKVKTLSRPIGCLHMNCVGDTVMNDYGYQGEIVAFNRFNEKIIVRWYRSQFGSALNMTEQVTASRLTSAEYCADYGYDVRNEGYYYQPISSRYSHGAEQNNDYNYSFHYFY